MVVTDENSPAEVVEMLSGVMLSASARVVDLAVEQDRIIELIARGASLQETLDALLSSIEREAPGMLCSVLLLDADGAHLRHGSAPSLPAEYSRAVDGAAIGPCAGSCGTAAYRGTQVVVTDIETDPLWADYRHLARPHGLRACWSTPILDGSGRVIGTFAMYFRQPGNPTSDDQELIARATHVASIAIGKALRERAVRDSEERYRLLNLATKDAVWDWNVKNNTLWWNESVRELFGYPAEEVSSEYAWWVERVHPDDRERVHHSLQAAAESDAVSWREDYRFLRRDGTYADILDRGYVMRDASGATIRMIGTMQDVSERKQAQLKIEQLAYHDPVTLLPNRTALQRDLKQAIAALESEPGELALVLVNLNYFRDINDTLGYQIGDLVLRHVGERLSRAVAPSGRLASLGADEYAVLLPRLSGRFEIERAVASIQDSLQEPVSYTHLTLPTILLV